MPQVITKTQSLPAALTLTARRWLPSRWTGASRSGMLHPGPRCSPLPSEEGSWEAGTSYSRGVGGGPIHALLDLACTPSALEPASTGGISNLVTGAKRRLDREKGKEEGRQLWPVGWAGPQVHSFRCEPTLENIAQRPPAKMRLSSVSCKMGRSDHPEPARVTL